MTAVARHLLPRPKPVPNAPGMFAFAEPRHVTKVLTSADPRFEKFDADLDIAVGRGLDEVTEARHLSASKDRHAHLQLFQSHLLH